MLHYLTRIFKSNECFQPNDNAEPIRSIVVESPEATVVTWSLNPGQEIPGHIHPKGQDTWTILSGTGQYYLDEFGNNQIITRGDIIIAKTGEVHGVRNHGDQVLTFISVVDPFEAGYEKIALSPSGQSTPTSKWRTTPGPTEAFPIAILKSSPI